MPELRVRMSKTLEGWFPSVTRDQIPVYATFRRSQINAWTVAIGVPREFVDGPLRRNAVDRLRRWSSCACSEPRARRVDGPDNPAPR